MYVSSSPQNNLNCSLMNGTTSECIEVKLTPGEDEVITTTTTFSGQVVPFTVVTGLIPTQTQKSGAVMIVGNPILNSFSGVPNLLGIFFVGILLLSCG